MGDLPLTIILGFVSGAIAGFLVTMFWTLGVMLKQLREGDDNDALPSDHNHKEES